MRAIVEIQFYNWMPKRGIGFWPRAMARRGASPLTRVLQKELFDSPAERLLASEIFDGLTHEIAVDGRGLTIKGKPTQGWAKQVPRMVGDA
jgi:hypothetical protein